MKTIPEVNIEIGYRSDVIGRIAELHRTYYHTNWGFGHDFEVLVASSLAEFLKRYNPKRDRLWTATLNERVEGSIAIDGIESASKGAHLRWFILSDALRGQGIGKQLLTNALDFCAYMEYHKVYLWTFEGLHSARHLYESKGFKLIKQQRGTQWGKEVNEQYFECELSDRAERMAAVTTL